MDLHPWKRYGLIAYDTPNDQGSGGTTMTDAASAAKARMAAAGEITDNADDPKPAADAADPEFEGIDFSKLSYQDGKKLEKELRADREKWRPFSETFGALDDDARAAILESAPDLGGDLAFISRACARLQPRVRQVIANLAELVNTDPAAAAEGFAQAAALLRGEEIGTPATPDGATADDQPLTRAEMERFYAEKAAESEMARASIEAQSQILSEAKTLGYDPDSDDKTEKARFQFLITAAGQFPDGNLTKAHELVQAYEQSRIDQFVAGKKADASRPSTPTAGQSPSPQEEVTTMGGALEAAKARLEAELGPLRR